MTDTAPRWPICNYRANFRKTQTYREFEKTATVERKRQERLSTQLTVLPERYAAAISDLPANNRLKAR